MRGDAGVTLNLVAIPRQGDVVLVGARFPPVALFVGRDRRRRYPGSIGRRLRGALAAGALLVITVAGPPVGASRSTSVPDPCVGTFRSAGEYQRAFAGLASLGTGWSTADGYVPVALPDGRTAWLMSDTLLAPPAVPAAARHPRSCTTASSCSTAVASHRCSAARSATGRTSSPRCTDGRVGRARVSRATAPCWCSAPSSNRPTVLPASASGSWGRRSPRSHCRTSRFAASTCCRSPNPRGSRGAPAQSGSTAPSTSTARRRDARTSARVAFDAHRRPDHGGSGPGGRGVGVRRSRAMTFGGGPPALPGVRDAIGWRIRRGRVPVDRSPIRGSRGGRPPGPRARGALSRPAHHRRRLARPVRLRRAARSTSTAPDGRSSTT